MPRPTVSPDLIQERLLALLAERGAGKTIGPSDVAIHIGGPHPEGWSPLMTPIRKVAAQLMKEGRIAILRKGKPVDDPDDFRGVYRIGAAMSEEGEGNSSSVLPPA